MTSPTMAVARRGARVVGRVLIWAWLLLACAPIVFMVTTSFRPTGIARRIPPAWLFHPTLSHYKKVLSSNQGTSEGFGSLLAHSAVVTIGATLLTLALAIPAAYALSMRHFRPRKFLSSWILSTYMFPPIVAVIPVFIYAGRLGLIDTYPVLVIPYAAFNMPIAIWLLRSSVLQIPFDIQEAAFVDGASRLVVLRRVIWPLLVPTVATVAILCAILSWNEFLFALSLTRTNAKTSPVGVQQFTGMFGTDWGSLTAASTLIVAPIAVMTLVLRRRIVSGLTFGAVK